MFGRVKVDLYQAAISAFVRRADQKETMVSANDRWWLEN